ncbi:hypothetical protein C4553_00460 [Candidatus Parcubacteria bacterium]|nr:MAG: hypothetical protein C4553_00460 [Candidatus Parcubacteria bacterium]
MTSREFFIYTIKDESPRFERLFKALPDDKLSWRPHERNKSAMELMVSMASEFATMPDILQKGVVDFVELKPVAFKNGEEAADFFVKMSRQSADLASKMTDDEWEEKAEMLLKGKSEWKATKNIMAWGLILDLIHHRGQLSVYIRPMGGRVPSIYGPSGDSK